MLNFHQLKSYFKYWLNVVDEHSLHSPFVYEIYTNVIAPKGRNIGISKFADIEKIRSNFQNSTTKIKIKDLGAGSKLDNGAFRSVADIAKYGLTKNKYSRLFVRIIEYLNAKNIVELGTSLGINTLYLSSDDSVEVNTFEGSSSLYDIAHEVFKGMHRNNIKIIEGNINDTLPEFIMHSKSIDLIYMDANHQYEPTIEYFELFLKRCHDKSCIIIDDIHLSKEMDRAWKYILNHYGVTLTMDLFNVGIVFVNPELTKQHYTLSF